MLLRKYREREDGWNSFAAGSLAGVNVLFLDAERRRTLALYLTVRALQCAYNSSKSRGWWHFWGSDWKHGDSLLFMLASAQIMYCYVMRPDALPESYWRFIVKSGPIPPNVLEAVRRSNRGLAVDGAALAAQVAKRSEKGLVIPSLGAVPDILPCAYMHPRTASCVKNDLWAFADTFKKTIPLYFTIMFVPAAVLRFNRFVRTPVTSLLRVSVDAVRSTTFLASLVAIYQACVCAQRSVVRKDHRSIYWISGLACASSILIERKSRRSELALYALPRALDSVYIMLRDYRWLTGMPHGETVLFSAAMGAVMYFYQNERATMSPWLSKILERFMDEPFFLAGSPSRPSLPQLAQQPAGDAADAAAAVRSPKPSALKVASVSSAAGGGGGPHAVRKIDLASR
jgi:hypothetical protein